MLRNLSFDLSRMFSPDFSGMLDFPRWEEWAGSLRRRTRSPTSSLRPVAPLVYAASSVSHPFLQRNSGLVFALCNPNALLLGVQCESCLAVVSDRAAIRHSYRSFRLYAKLGALRLLVSVGIPFLSVKFSSGSADVENPYTSLVAAGLYFMLTIRLDGAVILLDPVSTSRCPVGLSFAADLSGFCIVRFLSESLMSNAVCRGLIGVKTPSLNRMSKCCESYVSARWWRYVFAVCWRVSRRFTRFGIVGHDYARGCAIGGLVYTDVVDLRFVSARLSTVRFSEPYCLLQGVCWSSSWSCAAGWKGLVLTIPTLLPCPVVGLGGYQRPSETGKWVVAAEILTLFPASWCPYSASMTLQRYVSTSQSVLEPPTAFSGVVPCPLQSRNVPDTRAEYMHKACKLHARHMRKAFMTHETGMYRASMVRASCKRLHGERLRSYLQSTCTALSL
jgi:hypothetical protein